MRLTHGRVTLELHELRQAAGPALLLLHELYGSAASWGEAPAMWPGAVYALDFCGHGRSDWIKGGGYYAELLVSDADAVLAQVGHAAVAGAGLGAYVAALLAGARPDIVPAALLLPGAGLDGGGERPDFDRPRVPLDVAVPGEPGGDHDPLVRVLEDVRPSDYVAALVEPARRLLLLEDGEPRPPWWQALRRHPRAEALTGDLRAALACLAG